MWHGSQGRLLGGKRSARRGMVRVPNLMNTSGDASRRRGYPAEKRERSNAATRPKASRPNVGLMLGVADLLRCDRNHCLGGGYDRGSRETLKPRRFQPQRIMLGLDFWLGGLGIVFSIATNMPNRLLIGHLLIIYGTESGIAKTMPVISKARAALVWFLPVANNMPIAATLWHPS